MIALAAEVGVGGNNNIERGDYIKIAFLIINKSSR
jgi:hypothetical protein